MIFDHIHFHESGKGEEVILLHGFCETNRIWDSYLGSLSDNYHVIVPDLPGFGKSDLTIDNFSIKELGAELLEWLASKGIRDFNVIGHSLGGYLALAMTDLAPSQIKRLGLLHSTALPDSEERKSNRDKAIEFIRENGVIKFVRSLMPSLFYAPDLPQNVRALDLMMKEVEGLSSQTAIAYTEAMKNRRSTIPVLEKFERPAMMIIGENDMAVPLKDSVKQSKLLKVPVVDVIPQCGHMSMFEWPERCLNTIRTFLSK